MEVKYVFAPLPLFKDVRRLAFLFIVVIVALIPWLSFGGTSSDVKTVDVLSFTPPAGWETTQKADTEPMTMSDLNSEQNISCQITVCKSQQSSGDLATAFFSEWAAIIGSPLPEAGDVSHEGVRIVGAAQAVPLSGQNNYVRLITYSAGAKIASIVVITPTLAAYEVYRPKVEAFLASVTVNSDAVSTSKVNVGQQSQEKHQKQIQASRADTDPGPDYGLTPQAALRAQSPESQATFKEFMRKLSQQTPEAQAHAEGAGRTNPKTALLQLELTTDSGLRYTILKEGSGPRPTAADTVRVHYRGTLTNGTEFDSSYKRGEPAVFPVARVIEGWTEALQLMKVGSKYRLVIPPNLAYGDRAIVGLPKNATLIFDLELLAINPPESHAVLQLDPPEVELRPSEQEIYDGEMSTMTFLIGVKLTDDQRRTYQKLAMEDWKHFSEQEMFAFLANAVDWKEISKYDPLQRISCLVKLQPRVLATLRKDHKSARYKWLLQTYEALYDAVAEANNYQKLVDEERKLYQDASQRSRDAYDLYMSIQQNSPRY